MKPFDSELSLPDKIGASVEPPKNAHSGSSKIWLECLSDLYPELINDMQGELVNAVESKGGSFDGTKRDQLGKVLGDIVIELFAPPERAATGTSITPIVYTSSIAVSDMARVEGKILVGTESSSIVHQASISYTFVQTSPGNWIWLLEGISSGKDNSFNATETQVGTGLSATFTQPLVTPAAPGLNVTVGLAVDQISLDVAFGASVVFQVSGSAKVFR